MRQVVSIQKKSLYEKGETEGGETFCMLDYTVYSASVSDLTRWRKEGVIYHASQDPDYGNRHYMYAPDVVQGNDGRFYLYYCMSGDYGQGGYWGPIRVAVCDSPAGSYEYLGYVRNPDGTPYHEHICFDPAVLNDNGRIYLYSGTQYDFEERPDFFENEDYIRSEMDMFHRSREEILFRAKQDSIMGPVVMELEEDMRTLKTPAKHLVPYKVKGTSFEEHLFFEASSMRKVGEKYYFIYSSMLNHELCYAVSDYPDRDFTFGGTIVSNGDIGMNGRSEADKLNMTGTTHGSIEQISGNWYVFYHRLTHKSDYSRQACAERITFTPDGQIPQVEITSCGLNHDPLRAEGSYPAVIACNLTNGNMPHGSNSIFRISFPNVTHQGGERFIAEISEGTLMGYKYFSFRDVTRIGVTARMETEENKVQYKGPLRLDERVTEKPDRPHQIRRPGTPSEKSVLEIRLTETGDPVGQISLDENSETWTEFWGDVRIPDGVSALNFVYHGGNFVQMKDIIFG